MSNVRKNPNFSWIVLFFLGSGLLFWLNEFLVGYFGVVVQNGGSSFGLNTGGVLVNIFVLAFFGYRLLWKEEGNRWLLLIMAGGGLNLIDRLRFGFVRDYWYLTFGLYNNLADWIIALGVVAFIISLWKKR